MEVVPPFAHIWLSDEAVYASFPTTDDRDEENLWSEELYRITSSFSEVNADFLGKAVYENSSSPDAFYEIRTEGVYYITKLDGEYPTEDIIPSADKNSFKSLGCSYGKDDFAIYFEKEVLADADIDTFEVMNCLFARDKNHIYFKKSSFEASDPTTFHILNKDYYIDKDYVYYHSETMKNADVGTFVVFELNPFNLSRSSFDKKDYAKDKNHVYFQGEILEDADPATFKILEGYQYAQDAQFVYYQGKILAGADTDTFGIITTFVAKDNRKVYSYGELIDSADAQTFEFIDREYYRDRFFVYSGTSVIEGLDPATFEIASTIYSAPPNGDYVKDANGAYLLTEINGSFELKKLEDADPDTFEVFDHDFRFVKTRSFVYFYGKKMPNVDPASFEIIHFQYFAKDKNAVYGIPLIDNPEGIFVTLAGADPAVFELLIYDFGRDKNQLYARGVFVDVEGINIATVKPLSHSSFKDQYRVYCKPDGGQWHVLDGVNPANAKEHPAPSC
jgi:hypothetical protein